jgi:DNA-binding transcriptional LysR family regulator
LPDELGLSDGAEPAGRVRVASMEGIAAFYLSAKFAEFAAAMPGIDRLRDHEELVAGLGQQEAVGAALEQFRVEPALQLRNATADRRVPQITACSIGTTSPSSWSWPGMAG